MKFILRGSIEKIALMVFVVLLLLTMLAGCGNGKETDNAPPVISQVADLDITAVGATIIWTTDEAATSQVEYGTTASYDSSTTLDANLVTSHSVSLSGLSAAMPYHYRVKSKDASDNEAVSGDYTFTTATPPDTTAPVISAVATSNVTTSAATIIWSTDEAATDQVEYGLTTSYGSTTTLVTNLVTSHSVSLSGLSAATPYHYRVKSKDASDNQAASEDYTFTTATPPDTTPPVISAVADSGITTSGAIITWTTDEPATSQVEYGLTADYGLTSPLDTNLSTNHSVGLNGLIAGTIYHYRVRSRDASGNEVSSLDKTFTTLSLWEVTVNSTRTESTLYDNWVLQDTGKTFLIVRISLKPIGEENTLDIQDIVLSSGALQDVSPVGWARWSPGGVTISAGAYYTVSCNASWVEPGGSSNKWLAWHIALSGGCHMEITAENQTGFDFDIYFDYPNAQGIYDNFIGDYHIYGVEQVTALEGPLWLDLAYVLPEESVEVGQLELELPGTSPIGLTVES